MHYDYNVTYRFEQLLLDPKGSVLGSAWPHLIQ